MKTKCTLVLAAAAAVSLIAPCDAAAPDPVAGDWGLALPFDTMSAGHVSVERAADGSPKATVLWRWGSPALSKKVSVDGPKFSFSVPGGTLDGEVDGDTLKGVFTAKDGKKSNVAGWRIPAPAEGVSTKDAKFGEPIDLLADGLDGWTLMDPKAKNGWKFENGILSNKLGLKPDGKWAGGGSNLCTKRGDFLDFNLEYDVRVPKKSNSGVYLRGRYEIQVVDSYRQKVNRHNMAAYYGRVAPSVAAEKAPGEWQHVSVTLWKRRLTVVLNGVTVLDDVPVRGVTGGAIDAREDVPGPIYLQGDHSDADFKNMVLRKAVRQPKALVVMLDGMRADAVENADAPNLRMLRDGKWQPGYNAAWSMTASTILDAVTVSGPNHTAIATGVTATKHTVKQNRKSTCDHKKWPSWLVRVIDANPALKAQFRFSWGWDKQVCPDPRVQFVHASDDANAAEMPKLLAAADAPDAIQWYIDYPDHGGHGFGYYPYTSGYLHYVRKADRAIGGALAAIAARPSFAEEDWLVIVTADHGGYWRSHGSFGGQCETIPLIVSSRSVMQGRIPGIPHNYDAAPTALAHFGIDPSGLDLDGSIVGGVTQECVKRSLSDGLAAYVPFDGEKAENAAGGAVAAELEGGAKIAPKGGLVGGGLLLAAGTNANGCVCLKGSENLKFENGGEFAMTVWAKLPAAQKKDPAIMSNKDWTNGGKPGVALVAGKTVGSKRPGVCFNAGLSSAKRRVDMGTYDVDDGKWTFYAATRDAQGVLNFYQGAPDGRLYRIALDAKDIALSTGLPFHIGQDGTGKYNAALVGEIDEAALWTRTLSPCEVKRIYESGRLGITLGELAK